MASRSDCFGRSTKNNSSQRPLRNISGGSWDTSLAVATTNTGAVFSCIHEMKEPNTRAEVPPSVAPELLLPAMPFSHPNRHLVWSDRDRSSYIDTGRFLHESHLGVRSHRTVKAIMAR